MIGVFDSGIGGLFLLKELNKKFPKQSFVYLADRAHFPYGEKSASFIRSLVKKNVEFLANQGVEQAIVACNTASSILSSKNSYPVPVMGVVEASLRQAKKDSFNKKVGLLATTGTVKSQAFLNKAKDLDLDLQIYQQACPQLAPFVEQGGWEMSQEQLINKNTDKSKQLSLLLKEYLQPLINKKVDTIIIGCTHYLYLKSAIERYIGKHRKAVGPFAFLVKDLLKIKKSKKCRRKKINGIKIKAGEVHIFINSRNEEFKKQICRIWGSSDHIQTLNI